MALRTNIDKGIKRFLSFFLCLSILSALLPMYINSADNEEYDLPWLWPVPGSYLINGLDYYYNGGLYSDGQCLDIDANGYTDDTRLDVISATSGEVFFIQNSYNEDANRGSGWGNYVVVKSGNTCIIYAHLQSVTCGYGKISAGDVIGKMGSTGNSTGVHLHMQAYPIDEGATSASIHVFDKFKDNPEYVSLFRFRSGLNQYSKRYGEHITEYYKTLSGSYYAYSGGYAGTYAQTPIGAILKSARVAGARIYSRPNKSSELVSTVEYLKEFEIYGYYTDAYGTLWYLISENSDDQWVCESDVGFSSYTFGAEYIDEYSVEGVYGAFFDIYCDGIISVRNYIRSVRADIRAENETIASCIIDVNEKTFDINNAFSEAFGIEALPNGEYTYEIFVTEMATFGGADSESKTYSVQKSHFEIDTSKADPIPPLTEEIKIQSMTDTEITFSAVVTDNITIRKVKFNITDGSGFSADFDGVLSDGVYLLTVPISSLNGAGEYVITATSVDNALNYDSSSIGFVIPSLTGSEVRKVQVSSRLNLRTGPGTSYGTDGKLYNNNIVNITKVVYNSSENRYWGYTGKAWCAMEFVIYQSGALYNITYNLCGGTSDMPLVTDKPFNVNVNLSSSVPVKPGYTFVGWALSPNSDTADYQPSDVYSLNSSVVLYAIWKDSIAPTISDIKLSSTEYTNDGITLTVNADDNSGTVYYSFDGGLSWRRSNAFQVRNNVNIAAGTVKVKDAAGNVTEYGSDIIINNIDNVPPVPHSDGLNVGVSGTQVTFTFGNATDAHSGVDRYLLMYADNDEYDNAVTVQAVSGYKVTLNNGVYYAKLVIFDKVGNSTEVSADRFLIGTPVKLSAPTGLGVTVISSDRIVFEWNAVPNADLYRVLVSENNDFTEYICLDSRDASLIATDLQSGKNYYAKVYALATDGLYLDSSFSDTVPFETLSSDNRIYSFAAIPDAVIDGYSVSAFAPYSASTVNLICSVHEKATVKYYSDSAFDNEISPSAIGFYTFMTDEATLYVVVTAESGVRATYTMTIRRSAKDAQIPTVMHNTLGGTLYVGISGSPLELTAKVTDGGVLTVVWYASLDGADAVAIANGTFCTPNFNKPGIYEVYAVVTNTNDKCENTVATFTTEKTVYTVLRNGAVIGAICDSYTYNGSTPLPTYELYAGDGEVSYKYFSDALCTDEISAPTNAGVYYVKAYAAQTDTYEAVESEAERIEIFRADNDDEISYAAVRPTLRERYGVLTVLSTGVEYSLNGGEYLPCESGREYRFSEGDIVHIRYAMTPNVNASVPVEIVFAPYYGTDGFYPDGSIETEVTESLFIVKSQKLTADDIIASLEEQDNIKIYNADGTEMNGTDGYVYTSCVISIVDEIGTYKSLTIIVLGDVDRDGEITPTDVEIILMLSNGMLVSDSEIDIAAADIDGDGEITSLDAYCAYEKTK